MTTNIEKYDTHIIVNGLCDIVDALTFEDSDPGEGLVTLGKIATELKELTRTKALRARADGATWAEIGGALGVSKQAAQQAYGERSVSL